MSEPSERREQASEKLQLHAIVRTALVGTGAGAGIAESETGLDAVLPSGGAEVTVLRRAGLRELAARAGRLAQKAAMLPEPDDVVDPRPPASPRIAAFVAYMLKPPGKLIELHHEMFACIAAKGLRLPADLAPMLLTHPAVREHADAEALAGTRGAWLKALIPAEAMPASKRKTKVPALPPVEAWTSDAAPEILLIEALRYLPRPFPAPISGIVAGWLGRFRDGHELQRHPLGSAMRWVALGLAPEHLAALLARASQFYRPYRAPLVIAETRRRFYEELQRD